MELGAWSYIAILVAVIFLAFNLLVHLRRPVQQGTKKRMPGPTAVFPTGLNLLSHKPTHLRLRLADYVKWYGRVFCFFLMSQPNVAIGSASVLQELYQKKHLKLRMYPPMFDKYLKAKGILFTNNLDLWKVNRAAALQGMMKASHLKKVVAWAVESTQNLIDVWKEKVTLDDLAIKNVDIDVYLTKLTLDVIGKAAFSIDINSIRDDDSVMNKKIHAVMLISNRYIYYPPALFHIYEPRDLKEGSHAIDDLREIVRQVMRQRREKNEEDQYNDVLAILMAYKDEKGNPLDDEDIVYSCWDMFIAGHETTAHTLAWTFMYLAQNPECQDRIYEEVCNKIGLNEPLTYENLSSLDYISWVFKEALRLSPAVPLFTRLSEDWETIDGYSIAPMTPMDVLTREVQTDPEYWDEPLRFNPSRWEAINEKQKDKEEFVPYFPFGWGHRSCVGMRMAQLEAKVILAMIISTYTVSIHDPTAVIDEECTVTLRPVNLFVDFTRR